MRIYLVLTFDLWNLGFSPIFLSKIVQKYVKKEVFIQTYNSILSHFSCVTCHTPVVAHFCDMSHFSCLAGKNRAFFLEEITHAILVS